MNIDLSGYNKRAFYGNRNELPPIPPTIIYMSTMDGVTGLSYTAHVWQCFALDQDGIWKMKEISFFREPLLVAYPYLTPITYEEVLKLMFVEML